MLKGRKVTNPVVHSATGGIRGADTQKDLKKTWSTVNKAKTELRKIEHRLGDAELQQPTPHLNEVGETSITNYANPYERNPSYDVPVVNSGTVVDKYGRTRYLRNKSRPSHRKISRLDDKYTTDMEPGGRDITDKRHQGATVFSDRKDAKVDRTRTNSPKRVDFIDKYDKRDSKLDSTFTTLDPRGTDILRTHVRANSPSDTGHTTLTDSRAIRETEIRFLNDNYKSSNQGDDVRWGGHHPVSNAHDQQNRLTHVSVTVPSSNKFISSSSSTKTTMSGSTHHQPVSASLGLPLNDINSAEDNPRWEVGSTDSALSDEARVGRKFKKTLKDLDSDGLAKLKEKIRKQQEKASPREPKNYTDGHVMGANEMTSNNDNGPQHLLHNEHEPVQTRSCDLPTGEGVEMQRKVRKIAAGPPLPSYKGFSEAEVKYKYTEFKPPKVQDWKKKEKRKKAALKLQERKLEQEAQEMLQDEEVKAQKQKKMTRVIASSTKKPEKQTKKEIITTSSWRAGQELILRELGPVKVRRTSQTSDTQSERNAFDGAGSSDDRDLVNLHNEEHREPKTATATELERARALSEEARKVLTDLNLDSEDDDRERRGKENDEHGDRRWRHPVKRKAPKSSEIDKHGNLLPKQRHYDQDDIRKYIQKQKADRVRRQKEEERKQKLAMEAKHQQLEELRNKQKQNAHQSKKQMKVASRRSKAADETFSRPINYDELPRHHPFHEDRQRTMATSDSDRKKHGVSHRDDDEMETSDGSSTLTGGSMDELTPTSTPREGEKVKSKPNPRRSLNPDRERNTNFVSDNNGNITNVGGFTFDVAGVVNKFSEALHSHGNEVNSGYGGSGSSGGSQERPQVYGSDQPTRSRADRIQAIKDTAATLQRKIQVEAQKISGLKGESSHVHSRWALPQTDQNEGEEDDFLSRYDRLTGAQQDFSVFNSNLPGQQVMPRHQGPDEENTVEEAAIRIQAAYRGYSVRQSLSTWKLPSGDTVRTSHRKNINRQDEDESSITETSTFSEITDREDSENSLLSPNRMIGSGLRERDFHAGSSNTRNRPTEEFNIPRPTHSVSSQATKNSWETPSPDPFSVFNIFARQQRNQSKQKLVPSTEDVQVKGRRTPVTDEEVHVDHISSQHSAPSVSAGVISNLRTHSPVASKSHSLGGVRSRSPGATFRSESPQGVSASQRSNFSLKSRSDGTRPKASSVSFKPVKSESHASDEDTIEGDSYSQSFDSEEEKVISRSEKHSIKSHSKVGNLQDDFEVSSSDERTADVGISYGRLTPAGEESEALVKLPARYSPNSLEKRFYAELTQLESMEESMRQLTSMERTRAVSMAQQETVSLAQMLKARQQAHDRDMKLLEIKAQQEALDATKQLETARVRSSTAAQGATETMARLRGESPHSFQESSWKTQTTSIVQPTAAKTSKYIASQASSYGAQDNTQPMKESSDNIRPRKANKQYQSLSQNTPVPDTARSVSLKTMSGPTYTQESGTSSTHTHTKGSGAASSVQTASDTQKGDSDSYIPSVSGADGKDESHNGSISEDLDNFNFDETMTEDEMEEKSFRILLPSVSHRKRAKKQVDNVSVTSDEGSISVPATPSHPLDDLGTIFTGEDSFSKFTEEMVRQFMKEEELRAQHQGALLRLRERALLEKAQAEFSWLEQQKHRIRNKGADDTYPQIVKRQRGLKMRLEEQKAEIERLREANKAAARERQMILQQHEEIRRMRNQTQKTVTKLKGKPEGRLRRPAEVHTEDELSAFDERLEAADNARKNKDYKSDSEIYTEPKSSGKKGKIDGRSMEKMKKIHLDEKYLTVREHRLLDRRKNVENLLKWKKRLDEEEADIFRLEQRAIKVWEGDKPKKKEKEPVTAPKPRDEREKPKLISRKDPKESQTTTTVQEDTVISESITTAKDESVRKTVSSTPRTEIQSESESSPEERKRTDNGKANPVFSGSESSIAEEIPSSIEEASPKTKDRKSRNSLDTTALNDSYENTFEESTMTTTRDKNRKSSHSPLDRFGKRGLNFPLTGRDITSPRRHTSKGRSSESESEESMSQTDLSYPETQSDLSDFEGRIQALTDDLNRRKMEADKLKRERKKRKKDIMKNEEEAIMKQIETYDKLISQLKTDLQKEKDHDALVSSVKPQIKQPRVSPTKNFKKPEVTPPKVSTDDLYATDSTQSSPSVVEDKDSKSNRVSPVPSKVQSVLDKISEDSESRSKQGSKRQSIKEDITEDKTSMTEEIEAAGDDISESEKTYSGILIIDKTPITETRVQEKLSPKEEEPSYSLDFEEGLTGSIAVPDKNIPSTGRSGVSEQIDNRRTLSVSEQVSEQYSENFDNSRTESSFIKPLDLQKQQEDVDIEPNSPRSLQSYSTTNRSESRPSSERSDRSEIDEVLSESEQTPAPRPQIDQNKDESIQDSVHSEDEVSDAFLSPNKPQTVVKEGLTDIDQLLGLQDNSEDDITPSASLKDEDEDEESPRESLDPLSDFHIKDRVMVTGPKGSRRAGTLLYKGKVKFAPGVWAGVELDLSEGRNDGSYDGERYFTCRPGHGVFVPGDDLMVAPVPTPRSPALGSVVSSLNDESFEVGEDEEVEETDLNTLIGEADLNVQSFDEMKTTKLNNNDILADKITDHILQTVVKENVNAISEIAQRKTPPPVAPKPKRKQETDIGENEIHSHMNGNLSSPDVEGGKMSPPQKKSEMADKVVNNLLNDALSKMITIRNKNKRKSEPMVAQPDLIELDDLPTSPIDELERVLANNDKEDEPLDVPPRPVSPMPGSSPKSKRDNLDQLNQDLDNLLGTDYIDDELTHMAPPPYPGTPEPKSEVTRVELQKLTEDLFFAVPHKSEEVKKIVSNAVDVYWQNRQNGKSLAGVEPPDSYFSMEESSDEDLESKSRRVYKKLLFDLTGEIIRDVYKNEKTEDPPPWQRPKQKRQKHFRGASPPSEVDCLKPIVQEAVIDMLGLNGSRKADKNKWSVRKKKDHVDNILVQELREEEPQWVNYDDDENAVKMQLTETIFDSLLTDTVQVMNKIFRKRQGLTSQHRLD